MERSYIQLYDGGAGISGLRLQYSRPLHVLLAVVAMVLLIAFVQRRLTKLQG